MELERHQIIHLAAARGFDPRTVAKVLDGIPSRKSIVHDRVRRTLIELGVNPPEAKKA